MKIFPQNDGDNIEELCIIFVVNGSVVFGNAQYWI